MEAILGQASGKIILSGEYAVVFGYPGIAIPAPFMATATWMSSPSPQPLSHWEREKNICGMTVRYSSIENEDYLHLILDTIEKMTGPIHGHLTIENTIPIGCGMGSSTALVIAVTRCLMQHSPLPFKGEAKGEGLKTIALSIENSLNPGGSGLDFDVIWNECPILFRKGKPSKPLTVTINQLIGTLHQSSLIDTGKPDQTTPELVALVKANSLSPRERVRVRVRGALQTIGQCTERLLSGESPSTVFPDHHHAQVALGVVPKKVQTLIEEIEKTGGVAKVIGAGGKTGGGGIVLALAKNSSTLAASYGYRCLNSQHRVHQVLGK